MPTCNRAGDDLIPAKIRKRGSSPAASSSSSIIQSYRFKRAILIGKRGGSSTPLPTWRLLSSRTRSPSVGRAAAESSPKFLASPGGKGKVQVPVSARKLAATLWEMNEFPAPGDKGESEERRLRKEERSRERNSRRSTHSGPLPPHLSDPSHSPVSEMDRSGTSSHRRRSPSFSQRLKIVETKSGSFCNDNLMETESRSRAQTPGGPNVGAKTRLKDVSNALTTSKELIKIMSRMWNQEDRRSSSMSIISALHAELERARLLVNQVIREHDTEEKEIDYLMKRFAEERTKWKYKERKSVEDAVESIVGELEAEKKLRTRLECLNKRLGQELAETKAALIEVVKELKTEKRAREIMEDVCDQLAGNVGQEMHLHEEVERQRESKVSSPEAEKVATDKLRNQFKASLCAKKTKETGIRASNHSPDEGNGNYSSNTRPEAWSRQEREDDDGVEAEDMVERKDDSAESEVDFVYCGVGGNYKALETRPSHDEEKKGRSSSSKRGPRKSNTSLQGSICDTVDYNIKSERFKGNEFDLERFQEQGGRNDMLAYNLVKGLRDRMLYGPSPRDSESPTRQGHRFSSSYLHSAANERPPLAPGNDGKSRLSTAKSDVHSSRKPKLVFLYPV
ncbi:hypothetical protein MLD38_018536 [Melastoma candidum]|uniref:Uncharacterized protein n=1 Tax=Melastoma candidum TaxID=119954 RepID=A0ACB9QUM9_9MYRT|nr:hypothetical protein MLD38_018536 [Melastoma candidum]